MFPLWKVKVKKGVVENTLFSTTFPLKGKMQQITLIGASFNYNIISNFKHISTFLSQNREPTTLPRSFGSHSSWFRSPQVGVCQYLPDGHDASKRRRADSLWPGWIIPDPLHASGRDSACWCSAGPLNAYFKSAEYKEKYLLLSKHRRGEMCRGQTLWVLSYFCKRSRFFISASKENVALRKMRREFIYTLNVYFACSVHFTHFTGIKTSLSQANCYFHSRAFIKRSTWIWFQIRKNNSIKWKGEKKSFGSGTTRRHSLDLWCLEEHLQGHVITSRREDVVCCHSATC